MKLFLLLALCLTSQSFAYAEDKPAAPAVLCVNDKKGVKGAQNQTINKMIAKANDPLAEAFQSYRAAMCAEAINDGPVTLRKFLKVANLYKDIDNAVSDVNPTFIKKQCIEASLQRDINQTGYSCEKGSPKQFNNAGSKDKKGKKNSEDVPCLNQESVDYIHYSVNLAIKCFATIREPIDPRFLLKKINTETGFNFFLASNGGTGLGQTTSDPVLEIAGQDEGEGNARKVLEDLAASKDSSCEPFKRVIEKDLKNPPPTPPVKNVCKYVAANDGLARSLIMGLGYYLYNRDEVIVPYLRKNIGEKAAYNKDLINYATFLSYGPKGPNGAKAFLDRKGFKKNPRLTPAEGIAKIQSAEYISEAEKRFSDQLLPFYKDPGEKGYTKEDKRGDSCVGR